MMQRTSSRTRAACLAAGSLCFLVTAGCSGVPVQLSLWHPIQLFDAKEDVQGVRINLLSGTNRNVTGLDIGGSSNVCSGDATGMQIAGIGLNMCMGDVTGVQIGGIGNGSKGVMAGVQVGGFGNVSEGDVTGVQVVGLFNGGEKVAGLQVAGGLNLGGDVTGVQLGGILSGCDNLAGLQVGGFGNSCNETAAGLQLGGILNWCEGSVFGVQIALINWTERLNGVQIGLINMAENQDLPFLPFFNLSFSSEEKDGEDIGEPVLKDDVGTKPGLALEEDVR